MNRGVKVDEERGMTDIKPLAPVARVEMVPGVESRIRVQTGRGRWV